LGWEKGSFPLAEELASQILSLPIGPHLDHQGVINVVNAVSRN
jgi:dTDP-4-amino-4,6-dideoxygalactose transaminase